MEDIEQEIEAEFCDVGIDIEGNIVILEKLRSICTTYELTVSDLLASWFTFSAQKNDCELTLGILEEFNKSVAQSGPHSKKGKKQPGRLVQPAIYDIDTIESRIQQQEEEEDMLLGYAKTPQSKGTGKRLHTTPDEVTHKRIANLARTPGARVFSPTSFSPNVAPSPKYEGRINIGDVVASYPQTSRMAKKWQGTKQNLRIRQYSDKNHLKQPYKYMYQTLLNKADVLNYVAEELSEAMKSALNLDDYTPVTYSSQEEVLVCGRICCDAMGKLNSKSILLEGTKDSSNGNRIKFEPSKLRKYSFFPGQVVAAKGINTGSAFIVSEIYDGVRLPFNCTLHKSQSINEDDFTVYIACGPFITSDTLSHAPLADFLSVVESERPDLIVMLGPFVDCKIPSIENADVDFSFDDKFTEYKDLILQSAVGAGSKVVFVPSQRDIHHHYIYPQPPFEISDLQNEKSDKLKERIHSVSDPSTLFLNDVVLGITSTDILFHLGSEEAFSFAPGTSDRLGRLCSHIIKQQSYYPLQPPSEEINIDYVQFEQYSTMQTTPDILILPSDLRFFIKEVDGCLCINPGRLVKGQTGGTYAKLHVKPSKVTNSDKSIALGSTIVHIVKI